MSIQKLNIPQVNIHCNACILYFAEGCTQIQSLGTASASSVWQEPETSPSNVLDGIISQDWVNSFHSYNEVFPWLQVDFMAPMIIDSVTVAMRQDCCWDRFAKVQVSVGYTPAVQGELSMNPPCAYFEGPALTTDDVHLPCDLEVTGRYLIIQQTDPNSNNAMNINDITVCGETGNSKGFVYLPFNVSSYIFSHFYC